MKLKTGNEPSAVALDAKLEQKKLSNGFIFSSNMERKIRRSNVMSDGKATDFNFNFATSSSTQVSFKAKYVGSESIEQAKNEELVTKSFVTLKKRANSAKGHKRRILLTLSVKEGLKISTNETKVGETEILLRCAVNKITFHSIDKSCNRTFGFVVSSADLKYQFYAIKVEKSAVFVRDAFDSLFQVVARLAEAKRSSLGHEKDSTATLILKSERAIDVSPDQERQLKEDLNYENRMKIPDDVSLSTLVLNNLRETEQKDTSSIDTPSSSQATDGNPIQTQRYRQSGRRIRGTFAKLFTSRRRGTSMVDISNPENKLEPKIAAAAADRKSLQLSKKRVSKSTVDMTSGDAGTSNAKVRKSKKSSKSTEKFNTNNTSVEKSVGSSILVPEVVEMKKVNSENSESSKCGSHVTHETDPFGVKANDIEFSNAFEVDTWTNFAPSGNNNSAIEGFSDITKGIEVSTTRFESQFDPFFPVTQPKSNSNGFDLIESSLNFENGISEAATVQKLEQNNQQQKLPESSSNGFESFFDSFEGEHENPTDDSVQNDLFSSFALTSEACERPNDFEDGFNAFASEDFSTIKPNVARNGPKSRGERKAKSAFDLTGFCDYPNLDVFSDSDIDLDSSGGNSSPYDLRASSALGKDFSQSAWAFGEDDVIVSSAKIVSSSSKPHFFMRPTSVSGAQSVSNFSSSAINGSQSRIEKPALKRISRMEQPFDDPFFAS